MDRGDVAQHSMAELMDTSDGPPDSPSAIVVKERERLERRPTLPEIPSEAALVFVPATPGNASGSGAAGTPSPSKGNAAAEAPSTPKVVQPESTVLEASSTVPVELSPGSPAEAIVREKGIEPLDGAEMLGDPVDLALSMSSAAFLGEPEAKLPTGFRSGQYCSPARGGGSAFTEPEAETSSAAAPVLPQSESSPEAASAGSRLLGHISASVRAEVERIAAKIAPTSMSSSQQPSVTTGESTAAAEEATTRSEVPAPAEGSDVVQEATILPPPSEQLLGLQEKPSADTAEASATSTAATDGNLTAGNVKSDPSGGSPNAKSPEVGSPKEESLSNSAEKKAVLPQEAEEAPRAQGITFAHTLSLTTMQASDRLADKMIERLQQGCLEEASMGRSYYVFDAPLPASRHFSDLVARAFANRLVDLGFLRFEWWNGKDWREMPGRFCIQHDPMYDKHGLCVRVKWPEGLSAAQIAALELEDASSPVNLRQRGETHENLPGDATAANTLIDDAVLAPIIQQLQQTMMLQQQLILQSATALAAAEARAERAEQRALAAEQTCLEELQKHRLSASDAGADVSAGVDVSADADASASDVTSTAATSNIAEGSARAESSARVTGELRMASARSLESASECEDLDELESKDLVGM